MKKCNYRPISVLNVFSKVFERFLLNQMVPYLDNVLSTYLSAYRTFFSDLLRNGGNALIKIKL